MILDFIADPTLHRQGYHVLLGGVPLEHVLMANDEGGYVLIQNTPVPQREARAQAHVVDRLVDGFDGCSILRLWGDVVIEQDEPRGWSASIYEFLFGRGTR